MVLAAMTAQYERALQQECLQRARFLPLKMTSNLNGIWIPPREGGEVECPHCHAVFVSPEQKQLVARIINRLKTDGLMIPGTPDLTVVWPNGGGFIELKRPASKDLFGVRAPAGRLSDVQRLYADDCQRLRINHGVAHTWDDVRMHLQTWGAIG
jgi:hypothetical protein